MCETQASLVNPAVLSPGIGGTGAPRNEVIPSNSGGVGGTGAPREGVITGRPGIGGTGITNGGVGGIGGTGIVGVITGFASICINGLEVQYDDSTPVIADGQGVTARELAVGQVVAVRASGAGGQLLARNIAVIHAVIGPISRVDASAGQLELLGQAVRASNPGELSNLRPGDWVQVSGYRLVSGEVAASRIERIAARPQAQITGQIDQADAFGFALYGARVNLNNLRLPAGAVTGSEVLVRGSWDGSSLIAVHIEIDPIRQGVGRVGKVVLEGYVHALTGNAISLGNNVMTLVPNVQISGSNGSPLAVDQRVQISGQVGADERITVDRVQVKGGGSGSNSGGAQSGRGVGLDSSGKSSSESSGKGSSDGSSSGKGSSSSSGGSSGSSGSGSSGSSGSGSSGSSGSGSSGSSGSGSSGSSGNSGGSGGGHGSSGGGKGR